MRNKKFWNDEYKNASHLALSSKHSEDMEKWTRWIVRNYGKSILNVTCAVLDVGCGNGRNLLWLAREFGVHGTGYDISKEAIQTANAVAQEEKLNVNFLTGDLHEPISLPDASQKIVLDLMASHFLKKEGRLHLIKEIARVLKPGGHLLYKTFFLDEDDHARRLIQEHPGSEENSYIHPIMRLEEHVSTREEIEELYSPYFILHEFHASHRHTGKHGKRRSITVYAERSSHSV